MKQPKDDRTNDEYTNIIFNLLLLLQELAA